MSEQTEQQGGLKEVAGFFLKLGIIGFGGPPAHIALMQEELVERRKWVSKEQFLDLLAASNLIPGPNSTELAIHLGHARAGWPGLIVGGVCFIVPAMVMVTAIAWAYTRYGSLPEAAGLLYGVKPVIIAIVAQALWRLAGSALKNASLWVTGITAVGLVLAGVNQLWVLFGGGLVLALFQVLRSRGRKVVGLLAFVGLLRPGAAQAVPVTVAASAAAAGGATFGLWPLFLFFLKVGSVLFGSGYVLLAFLRADLVERFGWLSEAQLLDAIAVGQITPGPLFTTATFIGYQLGGIPAALVATAGIFLPAFCFVALSGPFIPRLRNSQVVGAFLDGVVVVSVALMAIVAVQLGVAALVDVPTLLLALVSLVLLFRFRINTAWLVLGGAIIGLGLTGLGVVSFAG